MNATTQIYRGIEDIVTPKFEKDKVVESVIEHLDTFNFNEHIMHNSLQDHELLQYTQALNPNQILTVSRYLKNQPLNVAKMRYLTKTIVKSYDAGYNDFIIDNKPENGLLINLTGKINLLKIKVLSDAKQDFGSGSVNCEITAEQNVGSNGWFIRNCFVEIKGNLNWLWAYENNSSIYKVHGKIIHIDGGDSFSNVKLILKSEQYEIWKPRQSEYEGLSIELMEE